MFRAYYFQSLLKTTKTKCLLDRPSMDNVGAEVPERYRSLIQECWSQEVMERPSMKQAYELLESLHDEAM